ncbi:hypothetical protein [Actinocatenispora rupis]|uniref:hypothetical protein n=1 Tax=Actinocatenispora rupis TaxID=519421 RepID=UPI001940B3C4|nr:hypothetical protein [Actinocatenispora rupis]
MSAHAWAEVVGAFGIFLLLSSVATVTIWQFGATWRAKAVLAREDAYRTLAERAVASQRATEDRLDAVSRQLAEVTGQLGETRASVERILTEVD